MGPGQGTAATCRLSPGGSLYRQVSGPIKGVFVDKARGPCVMSSVVPSSSGRRAKDYYPVFDWLRFILASVVCLFHFDIVGWPHAGELAVQVFFALSGWLIGGILIRSESNDLPRFFFNRGTRIWIPYALSIAIFYTVAAGHRIDVGWARNLLFDATLTHNLFECVPDCQTVIAHMPLQGTAQHFWSISAEEQFYLFSPFVILYVPFLGRSCMFWTALACLTSVYPTNGSAISFGVAAAVLSHRNPSLFTAAGARVIIATALAVLVWVSSARSMRITMSSPR